MVLVVGGWDLNLGQMEMSPAQYRFLLKFNTHTFLISEQPTPNVCDLIMFGRRRQILIIAAILFVLTTDSLRAEVNASTNPPANPVRLVFIHHSTGENWLSDSNGGLGIALRDNNYFVSDTNYEWGPDNIGSSTDIGHWWLWFRGPSNPTFLSALYAEREHHSEYSRLSADVSGENQIIMFKSCFPNSALKGSISDAVPPIDGNPLRGQSCDSQYHTVANAKGIYVDLLEYFKTRPDKLFVAITAPPLIDDEYADNARAFNNWLVDGWLKDYTVGNVFVFDFYNVLTSNGGNPDTNDVGLESGNHHRWWEGEVQHKTDGDDDANPNILEYPTDDAHPSRAGNQKATVEFVPLLDSAYSSFQSAFPTPTQTGAPTPTPTVAPTPNPSDVPTSPTPTPSPEPTSVGLPPETFYTVAMIGVASSIAIAIVALKKRKK